MATDLHPATQFLCGGRLVGEPLTTTITFYDDTPGVWFIGLQWLLDGEPIAAEDSRAFHEMWQVARRRGEPAPDWMPPGW